MKKNITHLVFSGGGLRAICLLGIFRYLYIEKLHDKIHDVAGTSMGAFFCLAFALKIPYEKLEEIIKDLTLIEEVKTIDNKSFLNIFTKNGIESAYIYLKPIIKYIKERYNVDNLSFIELSKKTGINLYVSCTNINKNCNQIFSIETTPNVSITDAVAASMSVPFLGIPIEIDDEYYIDGGMTDNFPIEVFNKIPKENILGVAIKISHEYIMKEYPKNTKISLLQYMSQIYDLFTITFMKHTLLNRLNDDILIIENSPIKSFLQIEIQKDKIIKNIKPDDIDELIVKGFTDITNYLKK